MRQALCVRFLRKGHAEDKRACSDGQRSEARSTPEGRSVRSFRADLRGHRGYYCHTCGSDARGATVGDISGLDDAIAVYFEDRGSQFINHIVELAVHKGLHCRQTVKLLSTMCAKVSRTVSMIVFKDLGTMEKRTSAVDMQDALYTRNTTVHYASLVYAGYAGRPYLQRILSFTLCGMFLD